MRLEEDALYTMCDAETSYPSRGTWYVLYRGSDYQPQPLRFRHGGRRGPRSSDGVVRRGGGCDTGPNEESPRLRQALQKGTTTWNFHKSQRWPDIPSGKSTPDQLHAGHYQNVAIELEFPNTTLAKEEEIIACGVCI